MISTTWPWDQAIFGFFLERGERKAPRGRRDSRGLWYNPRIVSRTLLLCISSLLVPVAAYAQPTTQPTTRPQVAASPVASDDEGAGSAASDSLLEPRRIRFGLLVGANFADFGGSQRQTLELTLPDADQKARERLSAGFFLALALTPKWTVKGEVMLAMKGAQATDLLPFAGPDLGDSRCMSTPPADDCPQVASGAQYSLEYKLLYVEVPLLVQYEVVYDGVIRPHLFAGPSLRFLAATSVDAEGQVGPIDSNNPALTATLTGSGDIDDITEGFGVAAVAGAGVAFPLTRGELFFGVRYELGLFTAVDGSYNVVIDSSSEAAGRLPLTFVPISTSSLRHRGLTLHAGYTF